MFPVTIGGVTYSLADFYPSLGYITALPNSIGSMYDELLKTFTAISTSSVVLNGTGSKVFNITAGLNFRAGQVVVVADRTDPSTKYMIGPVTSYSSTTLTITVTDYLGSGTLADWQISPVPAPYTPVPLGVSHGGLGGTTPLSILAEAGLAYPKYSMQRIFMDFENYGEALSTSEAYGPLYFQIDIDGVSSEAAISFNEITELGSLEIRAGFISARGDYADGFVSYGKNGFMSAVNGGPIEWRSSVKLEYAPSEADSSVTRLGLRGNGSTLGANFLDVYGMGFEFGYPIENGKICAVLVNRGVRTRVNTGVSASTSSYIPLRIQVDPYSQTVTWYVNEVLVFSASIVGWESSINSLLHPAFSVQGYSNDVQYSYFDYLYCTQRVSR